MKNNSYIRYGEAFKRQVVHDIETGKFRGTYEASRVYGIKCCTTVAKWLRSYGREDLLPKRISITTMKELDENKQLKKRVNELEKALADSYMRGLLQESYLEVACERMGVDVDEFKKKHVTRLSDDPSRKALR